MVCENTLRNYDGSLSNFLRGSNSRVLQAARLMQLGEMSKRHVKAADVSATRRLAGCLRQAYQNTQDAASDSTALEAFLRNHILLRIERDAKGRNDRLKKACRCMCCISIWLICDTQRLKTVHDMLSRLDLIEKVYLRAHADLQDEQKKLQSLEDRRALELAEEVDKVEADLKKCATQVQQKAAEDEVAAHKLNEMSIYWNSEWESFRIVRQSSWGEPR